MRRRDPHGVGIGLRREHFDHVLASSRRIDWLEIVPENFVGVGGRARDVLAACAERWPLVAHGVSADLGGPSPPDRAWTSELRALLERVGSPYYSDHLCWSTTGGLVTHDLVPLPRCDEAIRHTAGRIVQLADALGCEVVVENITYYAEMPGSVYSEGEFVRAVVEEADCGLLLDLNNVFVNAKNHGRDPFAELWSLPVERTRQIHLAGFCAEGRRLIDDHGAPVDDAVWDMYRRVLARIGPVPTLVEWDTRVPSLDRLLDEADRARTIAAELAASRRCA